MWPLPSRSKPWFREIRLIITISNNAQFTVWTFKCTCWFAKKDLCSLCYPPFSAHTAVLPTPCLISLTFTHNGACTDPPGGSRAANPPSHLMKVTVVCCKGLWSWSATVVFFRFLVDTLLVLYASCSSCSFWYLVHIWQRDEVEFSDQHS